jgi:hypothetical protein
VIVTLTELMESRMARALVLIAVLVAALVWLGVNGWLTKSDCTHGALPAGCTWPAPGGFMAPPR